MTNIQQIVVIERIFRKHDLWSVLPNKWLDKFVNDNIMDEINAVLQPVATKENDDGQTIRVRNVSL